LIVSPNTEWDEVRRWLDEINLPKGKAGAPRKIGAVAKSENPESTTKKKSSL
jgi:hypothetical protein